MHTENFIEILEMIQDGVNSRIAERRSLTLDVCQALMEDSPHWPLIRKRLLGFFGQSGLEADVQEIIEAAKNLFKTDGEE